MDAWIPEAGSWFKVSLKDDAYERQPGTIAGVYPPIVQGMAVVLTATSE